MGTREGVDTHQSLTASALPSGSLHTLIWMALEWSGMRLLYVGHKHRG